MARSLLIICQKADETDDLLGFFPAWISEFAKHYERVEVVALGVGSHAVPANVRVHSLGKERGAPKIQQAVRMARLLWRHTPRHGAVFCHMSPVFAIIAWPLAVLRRSRITLWYLHRSVTLKLRIALLLCRHLVTADAASLRIRSPKIVSVGHGIDTARWAAQHAPMGDRALHLLAVGRLSPIKGLETLIRAASLLTERGVAVEVRIVGKPVMPRDHAYAAELSSLVAKHGMGDVVHFVGFVPHNQLAPHYAWADMVFGGTPKGGIDKALLEGMAAGCVPVTSNTVIQEAVLYPHGDAAALADMLERVEPDALRDEMVRLVQERHELAGTIARIATLA
jgi:glycosyltransferase involved in cell wall biosynthesis